MLTNFFFFGSLNGFVLLPLFIKQAGGTEAEVGVVQGMFSASAILCQPAVGLWVDRVGRRLFMVLGVAILAASILPIVVGVPVAALAALRALQGAAFSLFFVANYVHVVDLVPRERLGWALGIYGLSGLLSTALAPLVGELVIRHWGFRASFALSGMVAVGALALVMPMREVRPPAIGAGPGVEALRQGLQEIFRLHMLVAFFFGLGTGTIFTFLPTFAELLGVRGVGLFYTGYAGAAMTVRVAGGVLIDTRGRRAVIVPSMFVQAGAAGVLAAIAVLMAPRPGVPVLPFLFLAGVLAGGAHGFLYPALSALLVDVTPERHRASVVGIFSAVVLLGNAAGAMAFGYVTHGLGYGATWGALAALLCLGLAASLGLREPPGPRQRGASS
jgi:MFS family permease